MGANDLKEMRAGKRDRSGEQLTKAGMICGIVGTAIGIIGILWWIIAVLAALGLVAAAGTTGATGGPVVCPFRAVTGFPCPTCGFLRTAGLLLDGAVARAFAMNPLDALTMVLGVPTVAALWIANRTAGWTVKISLSRPERLVAWSLLAAAFAVNWVYVLSTQR